MTNKLAFTNLTPCPLPSPPYRWKKSPSTTISHSSRNKYLSSLRKISKMAQLTPYRNKCADSSYSHPLHNSTMVYSALHRPCDPWNVHYTFACSARNAVAMPSIEGASTGD